jgi:serine/threonine-protein kinase
MERLSSAVSDRYRIERELGAGGMATVYLAEDLKHKRKVALKVLKPELAAVLGAERFVQEITTTAALQHPHILPLFDSGTADGFLYYVMPFIDGETLRSKLDRETQLGIDEAVRIATNVADALDYAHRHGVIHRDIKPENILLHDGRPMVADFGIALAVSAAAGGRMTETGLSLGTPHYMSPEQATAEKEITARSDVYSLASVLYEMLAGEPPHGGGSAQQIIMKIVTDTARPVTELRRSVPPNVAAAVAKALEKLPADRFASAKAFAEALGNPVFATAHMPAAGASPVGARSWLGDPRTIGILAVAAAALIGQAWLSAQRGEGRGPIEYDVGLPDSAAMWTATGVGFDVAPSGDFVVYRAIHDGKSELWFRSLRDAATRRIANTENGSWPAISPDGSQVAFLRDQGRSTWTLEIVPTPGGAATTLGRSGLATDLQWLSDGRLQIIEGDGNLARWFDPGGGPATTQRIPYCIMPSLLTTTSQLLCGGGGSMSARLADLKGLGLHVMLWTGAPDSTFVFGSHFRLIDDRYLVYLSMSGDLLAAPVNLATRRVGRSVRLATGLGRRAYSGAGTYAISRSGTLVYAQGVNHALGHLVAADGKSLDTLPVGRDAFLRFAVSPDRRRLAAVVAGLEGEELRVYDLRKGDYIMWARHPTIRQPVWSPRGDRLFYSHGDSIRVGSPDRSGAPALVASMIGSLEGFTWMPDDRVVVGRWDDFHVLSLNLARTPVTVDTLAAEASFPRMSPDGRWLSYNDVGITTLWLEPFPATGQRYQVATGSIEDAQWISPTEFAVFEGSGPAIDRWEMDLSGATPAFNRRRWTVMPEFVETAGQSFTLSPDGRVVYVRGSPERPVWYLRVVPNWVNRMKRAVDEANK